MPEELLFNANYYIVAAYKTSMFIGKQPIIHNVVIL